MNADQQQQGITTTAMRNRGSRHKCVLSLRYYDYGYVVENESEDEGGGEDDEEEDAIDGEDGEEPWEMDDIQAEGFDDLY